MLLLLRFYVFLKTQKRDFLRFFAFASHVFSNYAGTPVAAIILGDEEEDEVISPGPRDSSRPRTDVADPAVTKTSPPDCHSSVAVAGGNSKPSPLYAEVS